MDTEEPGGDRLFDVLELCQQAKDLWAHGRDVEAKRILRSAERLCQTVDVVEHVIVAYMGFDLWNSCERLIKYAQEHYAVYREDYETLGSLWEDCCRYKNAMICYKRALEADEYLTGERICKALTAASA